MFIDFRWVYLDKFRYYLTVNDKEIEDIKVHYESLRLVARRIEIETTGKEEV